MKLKAHPNGFIYAHPSNGRPLSLKTKDMKVAQATAKALGLVDLEQAQKLRLLSASVVQKLRNEKNVTVDGAISQYAGSMEGDGYRNTSISRAESSLKHWSRTLKIGGLLIGAIERRHIDPWVNPNNNNKYASRVRNLATITAFFRYCTHSGWLLENPALGVSVRRDKLKQSQLIPRETLPFTEDEVRRIVAGLEPGTFWHLAVLVGFHTGLRMGDIAKLEWSNIRGDRIVVSTSKTLIEVEHPLHPDVKAALSKVERSSSPYVFQSAAAKALVPNGQSILSHQFERILAQLNIEGKSFVSLRHTFALRTKQEEKRKIFQEMLDQLSTHNTMVAMGHASPSTTRIYLSHGNK